MEHIIQGCLKHQRESQKQFYTLFYGYGMSICLRYARNQRDAKEVVNDGFLKIFNELSYFKPRYEDITGSLKGWIRQIMIHTAIDHFRKNYKHQFYSEVEAAVFQIEDRSESSIDKMSYDEIINKVQQLSPIYRTVFNLYVIDGYKHEEIAKRLNISVGTSKSNLAKARMNIQKMFQQEDITIYEQKAI